MGDTWLGDATVFAANESPALGQETIPDMLAARGAGIGDGAFTVATDDRTTVYRDGVRRAVPRRRVRGATRGPVGMSG